MQHGSVGYQRNFFGYRCCYLHWSGDAVSPICRIFFCSVNNFKIHIFLQSVVSWCMLLILFGSYFVGPGPGWCIQRSQRAAAVKKFSCLWTKFTVNQKYLVYFTLFTVYCKPYCTLCTVHWVLYTEYCTIYTVHCVMCTEYCTIYTVHSVLYTV